MPNITQWSLSALQMYEDCPFKYKCVKLDKLPTTPGRALVYGIKVHKEMEEYLKGNIQGIPRSLKKLSKELINLKKANAIPEEKFVLRNNWSVITEENAWKHKDAWLRGMIDARVDTLLIDLKTGKKYDKYEDQAALYSIAIMQMRLDFDHIDVEFWYSKTGEFQHYEYDRSDMKDRIIQWNERVSRLFSETEWEPKANPWCTYCDFVNICPLYDKGKVK